MKIAKYALAALGLIAFLTPTAKADSFVYQVTSNLATVDVIFDLPTFQEFVDTTTFIKATSDFGPITEFVLSGNATDCVAGLINQSPGPCFAGTTASFPTGAFGTGTVPQFHWPGHVHGGPYSWNHDDGHHYGSAHRAGAKLLCPDPPWACRPAGHAETHGPQQSCGCLKSSEISLRIIVRSVINAVLANLKY